MTRLRKKLLVRVMKEEKVLKREYRTSTQIWGMNSSRPKQRHDEISSRPKRRNHLRPVMNQEPPEESTRDP